MFYLAPTVLKRAVVLSSKASVSLKKPKSLLTYVRNETYFDMKVRQIRKLSFVKIKLHTYADI